MRRVLAPAAVPVVEPERVLVFGSRKWIDWSLIAQFLRLHLRPGWTVIHGKARGADTIGGRYARRIGCTVIEEPITSEMWAVHGLGAGGIRNQLMLDKHRPTRGIGFITGAAGAAYTGGSADMAERLQRTRLPFLIVRSDGSTVAWEPG